MYNDYWLFDQGLVSSKHFGDLRDIVTRRYEDNQVIFAGPEETLKSIYGKMKLYDISQVPVLDKGKVVGIIDESDVLYAFQANGLSVDSLANKFMAKQVQAIPYDASQKELRSILDEGLTAILLTPDGDFYGLITRLDFINYLYKEGNKHE